METSKKKGLARTTVDMKRFAELRQQYREKKDKTVRQKGIDGDDDSSDDEWLDDEQWYCEHVAQWTGHVDVSGAVLLNPTELDRLLNAHFEKHSLR